MPIRKVIQNNFLMGRPEGYSWGYPGFPSFSVPYFETSDFWYSGHVGACTIYMMEFFINGHENFGKMILLILINEWIFLTLIRVHYIIDLVSGLFIAHSVVIIGEWLSYFLDVKLLGWTR
jgi:hypothetical protein